MQEPKKVTLVRAIKQNNTKEKGTQTEGVEGEEGSVSIFTLEN